MSEAPLIPSDAAPAEPNLRRETNRPKTDSAATSGTGWLANARHCRSPNHDQRPAGTLIDLLVIHNISLPPGDFGGHWIEAFFLNQLNPAAHPFFRTIAKLRVSAHLLIRRDGELVQFVNLNARAWHAGVSAFQGRANCNDFSIGIELEGTDDRPYSEQQYQALIAVTKIIRRDYPAITPVRILGHQHIAPERKTDPGPCFDWARYLTSLFGPAALPGLQQQSREP
jgi:AmpD protein